MSSRYYLQELDIEYNISYNENIYCFGFIINSKERETHLVGFKTPLTSVINDSIKKNYF